MKPFSILKSTVCPLDISNIDTDQIIPKQFLKRIEKSGFGQFLFYDWRYKHDSPHGKSIDPDFPLNQLKYRSANIFLTRKNFGCGSSREHAPWAILDYGFRCIIAESYADIFYNNCFQNGILPITLSNSQLDSLFNYVYQDPKTLFSIDLEKQTVSVYLPNNVTKNFEFSINKEKKEKLLKGLDDIALTLQYQKEIEQYEKNNNK